ncbi:hypothetical protein DFP74_0573 [Nocardiopsis sp. Huas11]|nr:hypothetical protein DFP74_0573 [Nocardiopsis sp. Huas11]
MEFSNPASAEERLLVTALLNPPLAMALVRYRQRRGIPNVPTPPLPSPFGRSIADLTASSLHQPPGISVLLSMSHPVREVQKVGS